MKSIYIALFFTLSTLVFAQKIENAKTVEVSISGNCGMCESTIEKAGNQSGVSALDWDKKTKKAQLTYDAKKTTPKAVLKRVAEAGYDNQYYYAGDKTYKSLEKCCQYTRTKKTTKKAAKKTAACCAGGDKASCDSHKDKEACSSDKKAKSKSCCSGK